MESFKNYTALRRQQKRRGSSHTRAIPPFVVVSTDRPSVFIPGTGSQYSSKTELSAEEQSVSAATQTITISRSVISESPPSRSIVNEPFRVQSLQEPARPEPTTIVSPDDSTALNTGMLTPERISSPARSVDISYNNISLRERRIEPVVDTRDTESTHSLPAEPNTTMDVTDNDVDMEIDDFPQYQSDDVMDIVQDEELPMHTPVTNEENIPVTNEEKTPVTNEENTPVVQDEELPINTPVTNKENTPVVQDEELLIHTPVTNEENTPIVQDREQSITRNIDEDMPMVDKSGELGLTKNEMNGFQAMTDADMYDPNDNNFEFGFEQEQEQKQTQTRSQENEQEIVQEDEEDENGITEAQILAEMEAMGALFKKTRKYNRLSRLGILHIEALEKTCYGPMREARNSTQNPLIRSTIEDFYSRLMNTFNGYNDEYQAYIDASASVNHMDALSKQMSKEHLTAVANTMEVEKKIVKTNKQIELLQSKIETSKTIENYLDTVRGLVKP